MTREEVITAIRQKSSPTSKYFQESWERDIRAVLDAYTASKDAKMAALEEEVLEANRQCVHAQQVSLKMTDQAFALKEGLISIDYDLAYLKRDRLIEGRISNYLRGKIANLLNPPKKEETNG